VIPTLSLPLLFPLSVSVEPYLSVSLPVFFTLFQMFCLYFDLSLTLSLSVQIVFWKPLIVDCFKTVTRLVDDVALQFWRASIYNVYIVKKLTTHSCLLGRILFCHTL
jgi:hypothetical protein